MVEERVPTLADIEQVAQEDRADGFDLSAREFVELLVAGSAQSIRSTAYFYKGKLLAVSGITAQGLIGEVGHIWMVSTRAVTVHKIPFMRHAKKILAGLPYTRLTCFCDVELLNTHRWLAKEGFKESGQVVIKNRPFTVFERTT